MIDIETKWATGIYAPLYTLCFLLKKKTSDGKPVCVREREPVVERITFSLDVITPKKRRKNPERR